MKKLGFSLSGSYKVPMPEVIRMLAEAGFGAVSPLWQRDVSLEDTVRAAQDHGMVLQSLHGPLRGLPGMWTADESASASIRADVLDSADACADYGFPILVIHSWNGIEYNFREEDLYFGHFDALVDKACKRGISVAFENLEGAEYLEALMKRYADVPNVGLCWDSGHEMCYTPGWDFLKGYGDKLIMTHLNDNYGVTDPEGRLQGTDDLHLMPYHGVADWDQWLNRLKQAKPQEILNFELKIRPKGNRCKVDLYSQMPLEQYFRESYESACRVAAGYFE